MPSGAIQGRGGSLGPLPWGSVPGRLQAPTTKGRRQRGRGQAVEAKATGPPTPRSPHGRDMQYPQSFTFLGRFRASETAVTSGQVLCMDSRVWAW